MSEPNARDREMAGACVARWRTWWGDLINAWPNDVPLPDVPGLPSRLEFANDIAALLATARAEGREEERDSSQQERANLRATLRLAEMERDSVSSDRIIAVVPPGYEPKPGDVLQPAVVAIAERDRLSVAARRLRDVLECFKFDGEEEDFFGPMLEGPRPSYMREVLSETEWLAPAPPATGEGGTK